MKRAKKIHTLHNNKSGGAPFTMILTLSIFNDPTDGQWFLYVFRELKTRNCLLIFVYYIVWWTYCNYRQIVSFYFFLCKTITSSRSAITQKIKLFCVVLCCVNYVISEISTFKFQSFLCSWVSLNGQARQSVLGFCHRWIHKYLTDWYRGCENWFSALEWVLYFIWNRN